MSEQAEWNIEIMPCIFKGTIVSLVDKRGEWAILGDDEKIYFFNFSYCNPVDTNPVDINLTKLLLEDSRRIEAFNNLSIGTPVTFNLIELKNLLRDGKIDDYNRLQTLWERRATINHWITPDVMAIDIAVKKDISGTEALIPKVESAVAWITK